MSYMYNEKLLEWEDGSCDVNRPVENDSIEHGGQQRGDDVGCGSESMESSYYSWLSPTTSWPSLSLWPDRSGQWWVQLWYVVGNALAWLLICCAVAIVAMALLGVYARYVWARDEQAEARAASVGREITIDIDLTEYPANVLTSRLQTAGKYGGAAPWAAVRGRRMTMRPASRPACRRNR